MTDAAAAAARRPREKRNDNVDLHANFSPPLSGEACHSSQVPEFAKFVLTHFRYEAESHHISLVELIYVNLGEMGLISGLAL